MVDETRKALARLHAFFDEKISFHENLFSKNPYQCAPVMGTVDC